METNISKILDKRLKEIEDENKVKRLRQSYAESKTKKVQLKSNFFHKFIKTFFVK